MWAREAHALTGSGSFGRVIGSFVVKVRSGVSKYSLHIHPCLIGCSPECQLPSISSLLENSRIRETNSMVICVQIHCPAGPSIPQQPSVYYVPRDLLDGLEASLDNASQCTPSYP